MKTILLLLAGSCISIANAQTSQYLDINQVKAVVNSGGSFQASTTGKWQGGVSNLWMGGVDANNQLHVSAQMYPQNGTDFWPGPLNVTSAQTNSATVNQYNRVWKLNKTDIDDFLIHLANGDVQNGTFTPAPDLLSWPANGDMSQNYPVQLAPFFDSDNDNIYSPMAGDYPLIKGDQAVYTIYNDSYLPHQSGGDALGVEIHLMAYAYGPCSITASNSFLNYTTFYNYKIINRKGTSYSNAYVSLFNDLDIGNYTDDFVGSDIADHYGYIYNGSSSPANEPAVGVVQLKGPVNIYNGIDDDQDGMVDEPFETMNMTKFMYFNGSLPGVPIQQAEPTNFAQYFEYMNARWRDGTPLTCGGNGYGGSVATNFAYPNNTYLNSPCGSGSWTESGAGSDKQFVMSSGPYLLKPGAVDELEYAYIASYDSITNNPLSKLEADVQSLHSIYNSSLNQCLTTGIKEQKSSSSFAISPNPTNGILNISSSSKANTFNVEIINALGEVLMSEDHKELNQTSINVSNLSSGIYFVRIIFGENTSTKKFIKN